MDNYIFNDDVIRQSVLNFMRQLDILPAKTEDEYLILDGHLHRYKTRDDKGGDTTGAYCIFLDHWPAGWVQDWRKGDAVTWCFNRDDLDDNGKSFFDDKTFQENLQKSRERQKQLREAREQQFAKAADTARATFQQLSNELDPYFTYLQNKKVNPLGVKFNHRYTAYECLVVPLYNINGRIQSLQYIYANGDKKFYHGASSKAAFCPLFLPDNPDVILVGEGYATMATVYQLTGYPSVAAMNCGNLQAVCEALKAKYPQARIIITADNDHRTANNPGLTTANAARDKLNLQAVVAPDFNDNEDGTDWNDFYLLHGEGRAKQSLNDKIGFALMPPRTREIMSRVEQINAQDLMRMVFPPLTWAVDGFLPAGCSILAGGPKVGKSILSLHLSVGIAIGGCVLGKIFVQQGDVLYLALEDTQRRLQERIYGSDLPENFDLSRLTLATVVPRQHEGGMEYLLWWLDNHHDARLVIIDTLQKFRKLLSGKGDRYAEDYDVISEIKAVSDKYNVPILIIHHLKKAMAEDWINEVSGSTGIAGAADTIFSLKRARTENGGILHRTGRDVEEKDFAMHLDGFGWVLDGDAAQFTMPEWKRQILDYLKEHGESAPKDIEAAIPQNAATLRKNLSRLVKEGAIKKEGFAKYSIVEK